MAVLAFIYYRYSFLKRAQLYEIVIPCLVLYFASTWFGIIRGDISRFLSPGGIVESIKILVGIGVGQQKEIEIMSSTEGDILQASARIIGLAIDGHLEWSQRILSFASFIFNFLLPSSYWPDYSVLATYKNKLYPTGGGGQYQPIAMRG